VSTTLRPSPLALAVLGLLEDGPLHPYRMQQLIKMWGKDEVINVGQRASLYRTISRLLDAGLIKVYGTTRDQQYPERTSYELTDAGRHARQQWLAQTLTTPRNEYPEFPAALSFLPLITPDIADTLLSTRRDRLVERLSERDAAISRAGVQLPSVTLLETEFLHAQIEAEIRWIDNVLANLRDGSLSWTTNELHHTAERIEA
jgi:DNA-binding PadR family transcriptional regulator